MSVMSYNKLSKMSKLGEKCTIAKIEYQIKIKISY
jgi:hypothetical protein